MKICIIIPVNEDSVYALVHIGQICTRTMDNQISATSNHYRNDDQRWQIERARKTRSRSCLKEIEQPHRSASEIELKLKNKREKVDQTPPWPNHNIGAASPLSWYLTLQNTMCKRKGKQNMLRGEVGKVIRWRWDRH